MEDHSSSVARSDSAAKSRSEGSAKYPALYCSFCGRSQFDVEMMIAGPSTFICNECVEVCVSVIEDKRPKALSEHQAGGLVSQSDGGASL